MLRLSVVLLAAIALLAEAALPPTPDSSTHPELAAIKRWLENGSTQARQCAISGGLFVEASEVYRLQRSEPKTLDAMMRRHAKDLSEADRVRLRDMLVHVSGMAAGLADLTPDAAQIAYAQLCVGRAQQPKAVLSTDTIQANYEAALRCERAHAAGSLDRRECVARAFKVR
ncbi:MAG TPA: hypothetical protein VNE58_10715 [Casimicrobiaceae bacterium]|nr:hypothetical protein [Casimicrobiaceae bacterium]